MADNAMSSKEGTNSVPLLLPPSSKKRNRRLWHNWLHSMKTTFSLFFCNLSSCTLPVLTQCRGGRLSTAIKSWPGTAWHHSSFSISKEDFMKALILKFNGFVYNYFATEYNRRQVRSRTGVIRKSFCCSCYAESINSFNRSVIKNTQICRN